jgi:hypothetical protein
VIIGGHIMELHTDRPGHYHLRGTPGNRLTEAIDYFPNFVLLAVLAVEVLADRSSRSDLLPEIQSRKAHITATFDVLPEKRP